MNPEPIRIVLTTEEFAADPYGFVADTSGPTYWAHYEGDELVIDGQITLACLDCSPHATHVVLYDF